MLELQKSTLISGKSIVITGSKSESNRALVLQALYPQIRIENLSNSDDTRVMQQALKSKEAYVDIHHAGTAMRFLTAYFALQKGSEKVLTGSQRMTERPIGILVDALNTMGANIQYLGVKGYPPLRIVGNPNLSGVVEMKANVSSQYISALLLIGSQLKEGLTLNLKGVVTSVPYIQMTLALLERLGVKGSFNGHTITVAPNNRTRFSEGNTHCGVGLVISLLLLQHHCFSTYQLSNSIVSFL